MNLGVGLAGLTLAALAVQMMLAWFSASVPQVTVLFVAWCGIRFGSLSGELCGFAAGLALDSLGLGPFGAQAVALAMVGHACGLARGKLDGENGAARMVLAGGSLAIFLLIRSGLFRVAGFEETSWNLWQGVWTILLAHPVFSAFGFAGRRLRAM